MTTPNCKCNACQYYIGSLRKPKKSPESFWKARHFGTGDNNLTFENIIGHEYLIKCSNTSFGVISRNSTAKVIHRTLVKAPYLNEEYPKSCGGKYFKKRRRKMKNIFKAIGWVLVSLFCLAISVYSIVELTVDYLEVGEWVSNFKWRTILSGAHILGGVCAMINANNVGMEED